MGGTRSILFRHRVNNGLLVMAFVLILVTSLVSVWSTNALSDSINKVGETYEVKSLITQMDSNLGVIEASGLRYMVTGKSEYLMAFREGMQNLDSVRTDLSTATRDNPAQARNLSELVQLYDELAARSATAFVAKRRAMEIGDEQSPITLVRASTGSDLYGNIRRVLAEMIAEENRLLDLRGEERDALVKQTNATVLIANGLALVAGVLGFVAIRNSQREAENTLLVELRATQARRASEEKSAFLANMSHEIRTPMNAIFGFTQLLSETVTGAVERDWVLSIKKAAQVLLGLINDVLDLSKIEASRLQLSELPTDLREIVAETTELFSPMAAEKGIFLTSEIDEASVEPVIADAQRLRQILMNLVSNAVKYTERGGVVIRLAMSGGSDPAHRDLRLTVTDSGVGIEPDQRQRIFEPFHQAESPDGKVRQGTGLGLSITRRLVDIMRGSIRLDSEVSKGSTFIIEIPDLLVAELQLAQMPTDQEIVDFNRLPPLTVLVVDDVAWNADVAKGYLRNSHHLVHLASDGVEGVEKAKLLHPDVVLMDLRMPRMDGYEARDAIRSDPTLQATAVIAVTASSMGSEEKALRASFDGYVRKPYTPAELYTTLSQLFGDAEIAQSDSPAAEAPANSTSPVPASDIAERWQHLRNQVLPELRRSMRMREIALCAEQLRILAGDWPNARLGDQATRLAAAVERFDISLVKQLLDVLIHWPEKTTHE